MTKPKPVSAAIFDELATLREAYQKALRGYRGELYLTIESAQRLIVKLEKNNRLRKDFFNVLRQKNTSSIGKSSPFRLSLEIVALALGAQSRSARQRAWKHAEVLDYFRKTGVRIKRTARTIKAMGGIEKIIKKIAKDKVRKELSNDSSSERPTRDETLAKGSLSLNSNEHQSIGRATNDKEIEHVVLMKMSDRDEMLSKKAGTQFKLSMIRVNHQGGKLRVTKIKTVKKTIELHTGGSDKDWA